MSDHTTLAHSPWRFAATASLTAVLIAAVIGLTFSWAATDLLVNLSDHPKVSP